MAGGIADTVLALLPWSKIMKLGPLAKWTKSASTAEATLLSKFPAVDAVADLTSYGGATGKHALDLFRRNQRPRGIMHPAWVQIFE